MLHVRTPVWQSPRLSSAVGRPVVLKMEALQPVGSFKQRGMGAMVEHAVLGGATRIVSSSGGNAGYAVSHVGRQLGVPVTIVVPRTTPEMMRELIREQGAEVQEHGASWQDAHVLASTMAEDEETTCVHPFDHPAIWSGHATMVHELAEQLAQPPAAVVVAVGGGGLMCGVIEGLHEVGWSGVPVIACETEGAASFARSQMAGSLVELEAIDSIAVTLGARQVTGQCLVWNAQHTIHSHVVSDAQALAACLSFLDDHRLLVEPACGAGLAAVYDPPLSVLALEAPAEAPVVVIVCGGAGTSLELLSQWAERVAGA